MDKETLSGGWKDLGESFGDRTDDERIIIIIIIKSHRNQSVDQNMRAPP